MKKIFIEDGLTLYNKTGIGQYTENLKKLLIGLGYEVIMPRKYVLEKIQNASIKRILYVLWLNTIFPFLLIFSGAEKVIFTNFLTPLYKIPSKKYYPVIHDLWAIKLPDTMSEAKRKYQTWILEVIKRTYYKIITVSNTVKQEILDYYNCSEKDIDVIYNYFSFGENPQINLNEDEQKNLLNKYAIKEKHYILSVGSLNKRKNIQMLIDAYNSIDIDKKLVIVGKKENTKLESNNNKIIFTGYLSDEELKVLYKNALLFIFPSLYEGFGIPLIDAQSFGVPVLCSNIRVFKEISENSVLLFNNTLQHISTSINELVYNEQLQMVLINKGYINTKKFSFDKLKEQIQKVLI